MVGPNSQEPTKAARGVRTVAAASVLICLVATNDVPAPGVDLLAKPMFEECVANHSTTRGEPPVQPAG